MTSGSVNFFQAYVATSEGPFDVEKLSAKLHRRASNWTTVEAYLCVLLAAAIVDGEMDPEERSTIQAVARRSRVLMSVSASELAKANDTVNDRMLKNPLALEEACAMLPAEMCLPVFAHCVDIVLSDGRLQKSEAEFLNRLTTLLELSEDHARRVTEVLLLKAQY